MPRKPGPSSTLAISPLMGQKDNAPSFGKQLSALRKERGMSQGQLAQAINYSTSMISMLENGVRRPTRDMIDDLTRALGLASDSDARQELIRLGGYEAHEIPDVIARLIEIITEQSSQSLLGESSRALASADLQARVDEWVDYFKTRALFDQGSFNEAVTHYQQALERQRENEILRACLHMGLAETLVQHGELIEAEQEINAARDRFSAHQSTSGSLSGESSWESQLNAETLAVQGLVAAHTGNYALARSLLELSITVYQKTLTAIASPHNGSLSELSSRVLDSAYVGIGSSYKRLAQIALLRGEPQDALTHCLAAESFLLRASATAERRRWLLRTYEQLAWAYSKLGDFDLAIQRRLETRRELERDHDAYGLARNSLYLGDDYLREIKRQVSASLSAASHGEGSVDAHGKRLHPSEEVSQEELRQAVRRTLRSGAAPDWIDAAEQFYREARPPLERTGQDSLLGRLLANLGMTLRYKALRDEPDDDMSARKGRAHAAHEDGLRSHQREQPEQIQHIRSEAMELLASALTHEKQIGHQRRLPGIYETLGNLLSDLHNDRVAAFYYRAGLNILGASRDRAVDSAASAQVERMQAALAVIEPSAAASIDDAPSISPSVPASIAEPALLLAWPVYRKDWETLCMRLCDTVERNVALLAGKRSLTPIAFSNRADEWCRRLLEFDSEAGGRVLAQNRLSNSLALKLPGGLTPEGAKNHQLRHQVFNTTVQLARAGGRDLAQDLCCREVVEESLHNPESSDQAHDAIAHARDYMQRYPAGYRLDASPYKLPLGFAAKRKHILIEAPIEYARQLHIDPHTEAARRSGAIICIEFSNASFAKELWTLFHEFVDLTAKINKARHLANSSHDERTEVWLDHLLTPPSGLPGLRRLPNTPREAVAP